MKNFIFKKQQQQQQQSQTLNGIVPLSKIEDWNFEELYT